MNLYNYKIFVTKVYDGDTITANIDLGFGVELKGQKIRLFGLDTPEVRGEEREEGLKARDYLRAKILNKQVYLISRKDKKGKYGRWIGEIKYKISDTFLSINEELISKGYAEKVEY